MEYYLRVEGINLENFVYDTNNLSTVRGGGLLLLNAIGKVKEKLTENAQNVKAITQGASWGLFRFTLNKSIDPVLVKKEIAKFLNEDEQLRYATFVVDILPVDGASFVQRRNQLATENRWQQMQAPSLAVPREDEKVCAVCKTRPAGTNHTLAGKPVSSSVHIRRQYGLGQKRDEFYLSRISSISGPLEFTADFGELCRYPDQYGLDPKMAVLYIDGNKFGKFQNNHCKDEASQAQFDSVVREGQNSILDSLIRLTVENENGLWKTENDKIRLETLLWGGDEIIWIVPARLGFTVLDTFYREAQQKIVYTEEKTIHLQKKKKRRQKKTKKHLVQTETIQHQLHHAAGLVFCHHKTPIHRVVNLAKELAELAKNQASKKNNEDLLAYQLLESFDHAGTNLEQWRDKRTSRLGDRDDLLITPEQFQEIITGINMLKKFRSPEFPRRKLYQIINALKKDDTTEVKELLGKLCGEHNAILADLKQSLGGSDVMWLHLVDLWDYTGGLT